MISFVDSLLGTDEHRLPDSPFRLLHFVPHETSA